MRDDPTPDPVDFLRLPPLSEGSTLAAEGWIALSHLRSKKNDAFISLVTLFSVVGVMAGVAVLNWVLAVMTGFEIDLRDKIVGANAHVVVMNYGGDMVDYEAVSARIDAVDGVKASAPFVYTEMMLKSQFAATGVVVKGMDPSKTGDVTHLYADLDLGYGGEIHDDLARDAVFASLADGQLPAIGLDGEPLVTEHEPLLPGLVIGRELMEQLQVGVGDRVQLINPMGGGAGPMGMPTPSVRTLRIAGTFTSGMYEYDNKWTYVPNAFAQDFLQIGPTVTAIEVKVDDVDDAENVAAAIQAALGHPYYTENWKHQNAKLFEALAIEKYVMFLLLMWIVVIAGLLIVTTLFMLVLTKGREIAILKAVGATHNSVLRIFLMEGAIIGVVGTGLGTVLGLAGCSLLQEIAFPLDSGIYMTTTLPVVVDPSTVVAIASAALAVCFVFTLYPAWRAAIIDPVAALRYE